MNWLRKLLQPQEPQRTLLDEFEEKGGRVLVDGYRRHAKQHGGAPTDKTSDRDIIAIYKKVGTAFREAASKRGEQLPALNLNFIVLQFLHINELMGSAMLDSHLQYEIQKYLREGLREDYKERLSLFDDQPLWHCNVPEGLQYSSSALVRKLDALRESMGLDHEVFLMALMQSENMTYRSVMLTYLTAKRTMPNRPEREYLAVTIADRMAKKIAALPFDTSPTAWTRDQLQEILDQAESFADTCKDINGVSHLVKELERHEGSFTDPLGIISRIDSLFSEYAKTESK